MHFYSKKIKGITVIYLIYLCCNFISCVSQPTDICSFPTRGLVLNVNDLGTVDWPKIAKEAGLTTLATHITPSQVVEFIQSEKGQQFLKNCKANGIEVEHELHAIGDLLPRELFTQDSTLFRMDENGRRVADYNLCVHSPTALQTVCDNAVKFAHILRPTTGRYFYWIDDGSPMCRCPKCKSFSDSEQALILENAIVQALREQVDPNAMLAHLAYINTLEAPVKVKPADGIFLEFAPIHRRWDKSLLDTSATGWNSSRPITHGQYLRYLDDNLNVFPAETAQVLEYWLDVSLQSGWKKPAKKLEWYPKAFREDIDVYQKRGIRHFTTFAVYIDEAYILNHKDISFVNEYGQILKEQGQDN